MRNSPISLDNLRKVWYNIIKLGYRLNGQKGFEMKNFYYVCVKEIEGKRIAFAETFTNCDNIAHAVKSNNYIEMWPCVTKKESEKTARDINIDYAR